MQDHTFKYVLFSSYWVPLQPAMFDLDMDVAGCASALDISSGLRGRPPGFYPLFGGLGLLPDAWGALIKGNADGTEGISFAMPDACGLRHCVRTYLKKALCHTHSFGGACDKYQVCIALQLLGRISAGRVWSWHGSGRVCLSTGYFLRPQGSYLPRLLPLWGCWVYCLAPEAPLLRGMPTGPNVFLAIPDACGLQPCGRTHLMPYSFVRWGVWQIPRAF